MQAKSKSNGAPVEDALPSHDPALIQRAVDLICESSPFRATRQCQDLLRYIVMHTLTGQDQYLRERVIGAEVFKRSPDYDPGEDPVVRNRAAEVRKRLAQYYHGISEGAAVHIDIPSGSYRAVFEWPPAMQKARQLPVSVEITVNEPGVTLPAELPPAPMALSGATKVTQQPRGSILKAARKSAWMTIPLLLSAAGVILLLSRSIATPESDFRRFWAPLLEGSKPVLVCVGSNAVYRLSDTYMTRYFQEHPNSNRPGEFYVDFKPGEQVDSHELQRAWNSFVALGDLAAVSETVAALSRQGKPFTERFPPDVSFAELQNTPAIVIGGFNNYMALTLTKDLRYQLGHGSRIEDRQNPTISWAVKAIGDAHDTEDYAIVSRLVDSKTGAPVISVAGIGQYGTQAAGAFVNSPSMLASLARSAPRDWYRKNMQVVLHVKVIDYRPISTEVVATYYW